MHGGFHPKSSTLRLYASRKEGGRGLVSVRATIQDETSKINKYIKDKAPTRETREIPGAQRRVGENLEGEGISGARGHWGTRGSDPQTGGVAPADPRKYIRHLGPEKCSSRNSKDTAQNPQTPRPLVEDLSLEEKKRPPAEDIRDDKNPPQNIYSLYNQVSINCFIAGGVYVAVGAVSLCQVRLNKCQEYMVT
uniref:Uncharacterized protein n=1 Tax=Gouania willdenowi TaxID=441366 RepID=A0A8C5EKN9_GOUWI